MRRITKKDFSIIGHRTGSRLLGHENDYVYTINRNGVQIFDYEFSSKAKASAWLGKQIKIANEILKAREVR